MTGGLVDRFCNPSTVGTAVNCLKKPDDILRSANILCTSDHISVMGVWNLKR